MRKLLAPPILGILMLATMVVASTSAALADSRDFTLNNNSDVIITHVYVSSVNTSSWEEDVLGRDVLSPVAIAGARPWIECIPYVSM